MAKAYNARCLVLKKTKLRETDLIVTMLSDEGMQIRAVANGVRKPGNRIGARLEPFAVVNVLLHQGRSLDTVREVTSELTMSACREGLERPACASVVAELLEKLGRDGAPLDGRVFPMSVTALETIAREPIEHAGVFVAAHIFKTVAMQGFTPSTRACAVCGKSVEHPSAFDVALGGVVCSDCQTKLGIRFQDASAQIAWVDTLLYSTFEQLAAIESCPQRLLLELAQRWIREHLSLNIKSVVFLNGLY